jgi:hypothetical protein
VTRCKPGKPRRDISHDSYILLPRDKIPRQAAFSTIKNFVLNYDPMPAAEVFIGFVLFAQIYEKLVH